MFNQKIKSFFEIAGAYALYLFVFLIPWQARFFFSRTIQGGQEWEYAGISAYATEILFVVLLIIGIVMHFYSSKEEWHYKGRRAMNIFFVAGLLAVVAPILGFFGVDRATSLVAAWRLFEGVALIYILNDLTYSVHTLAWWLGGSAVIQSILGFIQFYSQKIGSSTILGIAAKFPDVSGVSVIETASGRFLRAYGMFPHPNILGAFLVIALICTLGILFAFRTKHERAAVLAVTPLLSAGLLLTFSRTAFLALGIAIAVTLVYLLANKMQPLLKLFYRWAFVMLLPVIILGFIHRDLIVTHYLSPVLISESASVTDRLSQYQDARTLIADHWLKGVGIGNYTQALHALKPELPLGALQPVHDIFLLSLVELGIFGAAIYISLLIEVIKVIVRFRVNYNQELLVVFNQFEAGKGMYDKDYGTVTHWYVILSGLLVGLMAWFFFDHFFWTLYSGIIMFWLVLGLWLKMLIRTKT